jgi:hypothetical protein
VVTINLDKISKTLEAAMHTDFPYCPGKSMKLDDLEDVQINYFKTIQMTDLNYF